MEIPVLKVEPRQADERGKGPARRLRARGLLPAVCYGRDKQPLALAVDAAQLLAILRGPRGLNAVIRLDGAEDRTVFVQELQRHPVERNLLHVDFLSVDTQHAVQRTVPIELVGRPEGLKLGGLLQVSRRRLMVEALPTDLPESLQVDVSPMNIGDVMHVAELQMPPGVRAIFETNFTICAVIAPAVEEKAAGEGEEEGVEAAAEGAADEPEAGKKAEKKPEKKSEGDSK